MKTSLFTKLALASAIAVATFTTSANAQTIVANYETEIFAPGHNPESSTLGWNYYSTTASYSGDNITLGTYTAAAYYDGLGNPNNAGYYLPQYSLMNLAGTARQGHVLAGGLAGDPMIAQWTSDVVASTLTLSGSVSRTQFDDPAFATQDLYYRLNNAAPVLIASLIRTDRTIHNYSIDISNLAIGDKVALVVSGRGNTWGGEVVLSSTFTAVPEPATWALLAGGLGVVALLRRRRNS